MQGPAGGPGGPELKCTVPFHRVQAHRGHAAGSQQQLIRAFPGEARNQALHKTVRFHGQRQELLPCRVGQRRALHRLWPAVWSRLPVDAGLKFGGAREMALHIADFIGHHLARGLRHAEVDVAHEFFAQLLNFVGFGPEQGGDKPQSCARDRHLAKSGDHSLARHVALALSDRCRAERRGDAGAPQGAAQNLL